MADTSATTMVATHENLGFWRSLAQRRWRKMAWLRDSALWILKTRTWAFSCDGTQEPKVNDGELPTMKSSSTVLSSTVMTPRRGQGGLDLDGGVGENKHSLAMEIGLDVDGGDGATSNSKSSGFGSTSISGARVFRVLRSRVCGSRRCLAIYSPREAGLAWTPRRWQWSPRPPYVEKKHSTMVVSWPRRTGA